MMMQKRSIILACVSSLVALLPISYVKAETYLPEQRAGWCKNEVMDRYNTFRANVNITGERGQKVFWQVGHTGRKGTCLFSQSNQFVRIIVDPGEQHHRATGAIYWNPKISKWIAPDGGICHTCSAATGYPSPPIRTTGAFFLPTQGTSLV